MTKATEIGTETLGQLGTLAKQRREEVGIRKAVLAEEAGIESDDVVTAFENGTALPPKATWRELEKALAWKLGVIEEVTRMTDRTAPLAMEEMDAEDSLYLAGPPTLTSASDADLLTEVARRGL